MRALSSWTQGPLVPHHPQLPWMPELSPGPKTLRGAGQCGSAWAPSSRGGGEGGVCTWELVIRR